MLKLLTSAQMRGADVRTIEIKGFSSVDLMEQASKAFVDIFTKEFPDTDKSLSVYCGTGNNGGDGLAIARLLWTAGYKRIRVYVARFSGKETDDFRVNFNRLGSVDITVTELHRGEDLPLDHSEIIIDALFGSGLNKPLEGDWKELVRHLNSMSKIVVAVDIPSGFKAEGIIDPADVCILADLTITFQRSKINFLLPESAAAQHYFEVADIGLDEDFIQQTENPWLLLEEKDVRTRLRARLPFSHKGTFGHALVVAGAPETMGAALLCAGACVYTGAGLTSLCIPSSGLTALNTSLPEVMAVIRDGGALPSNIKWDKYQAAAIGPGLGTDADSLRIVKDTLRNFRRPTVIDADGLNLIASNYETMQMVPEGSVLTPHVKEFDRLFGEHSSWWERLATGIERATTLGCYILLKNRYSMIFTPHGKCLFNPTGTPAMATGGMGDTLTGMIVSFLAQGYSPEDATVLAVYLHGTAGESVPGNVAPPSRLIQALPETISSYLS